MGESLRGLLLRWLVFPLVIVSLLGTGLGHLIFQRPVFNAYDQSLANIALALAENVQVKGGRAVLNLSPEAVDVLRTDRFDSVYLSVRDASGVIAGEDLPPPGGDVLMRDGRYFYNASHEGVPIRLAAQMVVVADHPVMVIVAETTRKRDDALAQVALSVLTPQLLLILLSLLIVHVAVGRGLNPLEFLRRQIKSRSPLDLRPVDESYAVEEVRPLVAELNALLHRLDEAGRSQREFIANAAHQLRTPLAGLMTQLELACGNVDAAQRQAHITNALDASRRSAHMVSQLLTLSAAEPEGRSHAEMAPLDLADVVRERMDAWVRQALGAEVDLGFDLAPAPLVGDRLLLGEMVANLVDNALRYGRRGGVATVRCRREGRNGRRVILSVEDDGPGIPPEQRQRVMERFYRAPGSAPGGSGLGLAIVREVAERHGGEVELDSAPGGQGALITVFLPAGDMA